jgi:histidinol-phosphate aminotransferase
VLRSLTKTWGLAGLRIGYVLAPADLVARLAEAQPLWAVSTPALVAAVACASEDARAEEARIAREITGDRAYLLGRLPVRVAAPPRSSFVLLEVPDGARVRASLRDRGYAVRRGETFPGLGPDHLRVAVRAPEVTDGFVGALREVL